MQGQARPGCAAEYGRAIRRGIPIKATCTVSCLGSEQPLSATSTSRWPTLPWVSVQSEKHSEATRVSGCPAVCTVPVMAVVNDGSGPV
ncbi:hypothetical protein [Hymenobacter sp. BRD67]|uniref:hypothetical protein n=1 Tax=Hymenobacter sp. BRD67 TaxID=2675877 RepID=UPI001562ED58|nr:hypothetical protein [Hymenobacter sp. BRD67]QKG52579.1 hypothetical protein GKZ67_08155 [Hymenobacter sp. BRD67]